MKTGPVRLPRGHAPKWPNVTAAAAAPTSLQLATIYFQAAVVMCFKNKKKRREGEREREKFLTAAIAFQRCSFQLLTGTTLGATLPPPPPRRRPITIPTPSTHTLYFAGDARRETRSSFGRDLAGRRLWGLFF